jgi:hypothetical protein
MPERARRVVTSNVHRRYKFAFRVGKGIPAVFTANTNPLLFPFLKELAAAANKQVSQRASEKFPRPLPVKASSHLDAHTR